jgi:hypothetical protein
MHPDKKHYKVMVFNHGFGANMIEARCGSDASD